MKGLITNALAAAGLLALVGCCSTCGNYHDIVDPCYPQRYNAMARHEVNEAMAPQMANGHVLDQTIWDEHFEAGTDKLTPGGMEQLKIIARRRPQADPVVFVQAAQDVAYDPAHPDVYVKARADLTGKRVAAVQAFLGAYTAGAPVEFRVAVHDPGAVGQYSAGVTRAAQAMHASYQGALSSGGATTSGGGGAAGGGGR